MSDLPSNREPDQKDPLEGCTRLAIVVWGAIVAPIAVGLALGVAVVTGAEVLFGAFNLPGGADVDLAIVFLLALIAVLLAGFCLRQAVLEGSLAEDGTE